MEEKKRFRPSLTEFKSLQAELESQIALTSRLAKDCDDWRDKFREKVKECDGMAASCKKKDSELSALARSNKLMEAELSKKESECEFLRAVADEKAAETQRLLSRGLWARILNRR